MTARLGRCLVFIAPFLNGLDRVCECCVLIMITLDPWALLFSYFSEVNRHVHILLRFLPESQELVADASAAATDHLERRAEVEIEVALVRLLVCVFGTAFPLEV